VLQYFIVAPMNADEWPPGAYYGNVTLTSRSLPISGVYSLEYDSHMNRNALFVDIKLTVPATSRAVTFRVGNTHLESLTIPGTAMRPVQLGLVADVLMEEDLFGGIVGGDMNAISPSDIGLPEKVGLMDAYEGEDNEDSYTWGYQPPCEFPPGRMDKFLAAPGAGGYYTNTIDKPQRIGLGLKTDKDRWVSDHTRLITTHHRVVSYLSPAQFIDNFT
jgi:tyrosyl-DNA phosphodiesterase 2